MQPYVAITVQVGLHKHTLVLPLRQGETPRDALLAACRKVDGSILGDIISLVAADSVGRNQGQ